MSILVLIGMIALKGVALIGIGACLGTGIWLAKKFHNRIDEFLLTHNEYKLQQLAEEMKVNALSITS